MKKIFILVLALLLNFSYTAESQIIGVGIRARIGVWFASRSYDKTAYYVSATGLDTNDGTSPSTAVKTISKANTLDLSGTRKKILFKKGDTFSGTLIASTSGTVGTPITYDSYGSGAKPVITGFTEVTGWTKRSNTDVYVKKVPTTVTPEILTINGVQYAMGRTPNSNRYAPTVNDYYHIDSFTGDSIITDSECNAATTDWDNATIIFKTPAANRWLKTTITNHTGTSLKFVNPGDGYEKNLGIGYGYFIQNDLRTLNQFGEWYFNPSTDSLYIVGKATTGLTGYTVEITTVNDLIDVNKKDYIAIKNIAFEGANDNAIQIIDDTGTFNTTVENCTFNYNHLGVKGFRAQELTVKNCTFTNSLHQAIQNHWYSDGAYIAYNTIDSTGLIPGAGLSNWYTGKAITQTYSGHTYSSRNSIIEYNTVKNSGFTGIHFSGDSMKVRYNFVDTYGLNKTDNGGIQFGDQDTFVNMTIANNIVLNGMPNTEKDALPAGDTVTGTFNIYLDYTSDGGFLIENNTLAQINTSGVGMMIHGSSNVTIRNNTIYNFRNAVRFQEIDEIPHPQRNIEMKHNYIIGDTTDTSYLVWYRSENNDLDQLGDLDSNYYSANHINATPFATLINTWADTKRSFTSWKSATTHDTNSYFTANNDSVIFDYNKTNSAKTVNITGTYSEADSTEHTGNYTLQPFESIVLFKPKTPLTFSSYVDAGQTSVLGSTTASPTMRSVQFTVPNTGYITSISMYAYAASGNILFGVYSDNSDTPNVLLGTTDATAVRTTVGWQTVNLTAPLAVTSGQKVWIAYLPQNSLNIYYTVSPTPYLRAVTISGWVDFGGVLPATFAETGVAAGNYSIYFTVGIE